MRKIKILYLFNVFILFAFKFDTTNTKILRIIGMIDRENDATGIILEPNDYTDSIQNIKNENNLDLVIQENTNKMDVNDIEIVNDGKLTISIGMRKPEFQTQSSISVINTSTAFTIFDDDVNLPCNTNIENDANSINEHKSNCKKQPPKPNEQVMYMNIQDIENQCPRFVHKNVNTLEFMETPFNDTCLALFFAKMNNHLKRYNEWETLTYSIIYFVISIFAVIGNGVVILSVIRKKEMRTNRNTHIINLTVSNLILGIIVVPLLWWPSIDFEFPYSKFFCKFANALPGSNIYCSTLTISIMAIDRYYSVKNMNIQSERTQRFRMIFISIAIWAASFVLSLPLLIFYDTTMLYVFKDVKVIDTSPGSNGSIITKSYGWRQCRLSPGGNGDTRVVLGTNITLDIQIIVSTLQVAFLYVIPLVVLLSYNMKLTRFLNFNAQQINRSRRETLHRKSIAPLPTRSKKLTNLMGNGINGIGRNVSRDSNGIIINGISRWSFSSIKKMSLTDTTCAVPILGAANIVSDSARGQIAQIQRHSLPTTPLERAAERRRSRTTFLLVAMACSYAVLWFPFTLISILIDMGYLHNENESVDQVCKLISISSICVNPFLYGFLNTNFRHEFNDIFNSCKKFIPNIRNFRQIHRRDNYSNIDTSNQTRTIRPMNSLRQSLLLSPQGKTTQLSTTLEEPTISIVEVKTPNISITLLNRTTNKEQDTTTNTNQTNNKEHRQRHATIIGRSCTLIGEIPIHDEFLVVPVPVV